MIETKFTYGVGTLAYLDSHAGLVPCKVTAITSDKVTAKVTKGLRSWKKGETIVFTHSMIVPRKRIVQHKTYQSILPYKWQVNQ